MLGGTPFFPEQWPEHTPLGRRIGLNCEKKKLRILTTFVETFPSLGSKRAHGGGMCKLCCTLTACRCSRCMHHSIPRWDSTPRFQFCAGCACCHDLPTDRCLGVTCASCSGSTEARREVQGSSLPCFLWAPQFGIKGQSELPGLPPFSAFEWCQHWAGVREERVCWVAMTMAWIVYCFLAREIHAVCKPLVL